MSRADAFIRVCVCVFICASSSSAYQDYVEWITVALLRFYLK